MISDVDHLSCAYGHLYIFFGEKYSSPLLIFESGFIFVVVEF